MEERYFQMHGATLELGKIEFSVYENSENGSFTKLYPQNSTIKFNDRENLIKRDDLFIDKEELNIFLRYSFNRIERIASSQYIPAKQKTILFFLIGKTLVDAIHANPMDVHGIQNFGRFIKSYIDLMMHSDKAANLMLEEASQSRYAVSHGFNVSTVSMLIGKRLYGNNRLKLWELGVGGLLIDLGMTRISSDITKKKGKLSESELMIMRQHTFIGKKISERLDLDKTIIDMVYYHHERYDGSGYPKGLKGEEIPKYARIAAVADVYDAITTDRSYRKGKNYIEALSEIYKLRHQFDPKILDTLLKVVLKSEKLVNNFKRSHEKLEADQ